MIKRKILLATACATLVAAVAMGSSGKTDAAKPDVLIPATQRKDAPRFRLPDQDGRPIALTAYRGKVVLLDFWATWCGGCKLELPWYVEFDHQYRDKGLAIIGVSMDDGGMKVVKPFLAEKHIEYRVVLGNDNLARQYNLTSMPMTLLIDRNGKIAVSHTGVVNKPGFEENINALLRQP